MDRAVSTGEDIPFVTHILWGTWMSSIFHTHGQGVLLVATSSRRLAIWEKKEDAIRLLPPLGNLEQRLGLIPRKLLVWKVLERNLQVLRPLKKQGKDV